MRERTQTSLEERRVPAHAELPPHALSSASGSSSLPPNQRSPGSKAEEATLALESLLICVRLRRPVGISPCARRVTDSVSYGQCSDGFSLSLVTMSSRARNAERCAVQ
ncbi:hypothetical protein SKAU_G00392600 [Synaphobranchus kaupii]|uniref:Uncharacterized protein n=1 Tax=Synaphobranchus kaupii TaxID=118154 RepID=A0A9Q1EBR6_SYNKA|nr:hypothetical protein SKAU_G00392600 [Synaphobranchus kaupii]